MLTLIRAGGFPMVFVILFGCLALAWAIAMAVRPDRRKLPFITWMSVATAFAICSGFAADFGATFYHMAHNAIPQDEYLPTLMQGLGESMSPGIIGFSLLSLTALATAMGARRLAKLDA